MFARYTHSCNISLIAMLIWAQLLSCFKVVVSLSKGVMGDLPETEPEYTTKVLKGSDLLLEMVQCDLVILFLDRIAEVNVCCGPRR
jgi:hypothetical protein